MYVRMLHGWDRTQNMPVADLSSFSYGEKKEEADK